MIGLLNRLAFKKLARFSDQYDPKELESFENHVNAKMSNIDALAFGPFAPTDTVVTPPSSTNANVLARYFELVRVDPSTGSGLVLLPRPDVVGAGAIIIKNQTSSGAAITVRALASDVTVDRQSSVQIIGPYASVTLHPDGARKNWIIAAQSGPTILLFDDIVTFPTSAGSSTTTLYTAPASPSGADRIVLSTFSVRTDGIAGGDTGTVTVKVGSTAGGVDYMTGQPVTNATPAGLIGGVSLATLGTAMPAAKGYRGVLAASAQVFIQATTAGGTVTAGKSARIKGWGWAIP